MRPVAESNVVGPVKAVKPVKDLAMTHANGTYTIVGHNTDGSLISWHGTNRQTALDTLEMFAGRML